MKDIISFIGEKNRYLGTTGMALGMSGGVDSSVCAALACLALGSSNCLGVIIPAHDSDPQDEKDAKEISDLLGMRYIVHPLDLTEFEFIERDFEKEIKPLLLTMKNLLPPEIELPYIMKLRGRMFIITYYARKNNYMQCQTLEKTEWMLGQMDKFGDGVGDIAPIRHLYKSQVYQLAEEFVGMGMLPGMILNRSSGSGNYPMSNYEELGGLSYDEVDRILRAIETKDDDVASSLISDISYEGIKKVTNLVKISESKRNIPFMMS